MLKRRPVTSEQILNAKVLANTSVRTENRGKELVLVVPRKKTLGTKLMAFLLPVPREKKLVLDELGREVYEDCLRGLTVEQIIRNFGERHQLSRNYSQKSVMAYLQNLTRRSIIGLAVEEKS